MVFEHLLAVVPVSDLDRAAAYYEKLFGRPADNNPMPSLVEWQVVPGGWVQVFVDEDRAGSGLLNLAVSDLAAAIDDATAKGLDPGDVQAASKGVEIATVTDPDSNTIALIGNFRVEY